MKNYSLELRSIFDKPYFSVNVADLSLLEKLQNGLKELGGVKNVNISEGKRRHLTIYGETFVDVKEVHKQIKDYLDAFNDANNILENSSKEQVKNPVDNFTPPVPQYTEIPKDCPTVFISHAWDDEEHKKWILKLAHDLEAVYGINVLCDFYNQGGIDLTSFMIHGISKANRVLIIGTPKYKEKSESLDNSGVSFEGMIMSSILFREKNVEAKFIPILKEGSFESSFNTMMGVRTGYDLSTVENYNANIKLLAQDVWNEPAIQRPKRAHKPNFNRVDREEKQESELPIWKKIVLYEKMQPEEFLVAYNTCLGLLRLNNIQNPIQLAHLVSTFVELDAKGVSLSSEDKNMLKRNIDRLLSSKGNRDDLYECYILYAQTLNVNGYDKDMSDFSCEIRHFFHNRERELWEQFKYKLVLLLENLDDSNVLELKSLHLTAPDHGTAYSSLPLLKYVDLDKLVAKILKLSSTSRTMLADFLIERYFLSYGVESVNENLREDIDALKELSDKLQAAICSLTPVEKLSYYKLTNAITSAFKRCEGTTIRLVD